MACLPQVVRSGIQHQSLPLKLRPDREQRVDEFSDAGRIRRDGVFGRQFVYVAEFVLEVLVFSGETGQSQAHGGCFIRTAWQPPSVPNVTVSSDVFADHAKLLFARQPALTSPVEADAFPASEPGSAPPLNFPRLFGRVIIDSSCKSKALHFLADEKEITASTIFLDVVGLGRFLRWQFDSLRTMLM